MTSPVKIEANRQNAQQSTGPITPEGRERSSKNATRHGFTGQTLVITPAEKEAYEAHVKGFFSELSPIDQQETNVVQQLADLNWCVQQIFVQQCNLISLINAITEQLAPNGDALATANANTQHIKSLNTLSLYDQRKRRAIAALREELTGLQKARAERERTELAQAAQHYKLFKAKGQPWVPADSGFVCSLEDIEAYLKGQALAAEVKSFQNAAKPASAEALTAGSR
jgi:hypothetical protein